MQEGRSDSRQGFFMTLGSLILAYFLTQKSGFPWNILGYNMLTKKNLLVAENESYVLRERERERERDTKRLDPS